MTLPTTILFVACPRSGARSAVLYTILCFLPLDRHVTTHGVKVSLVVWCKLPIAVMSSLKKLLLSHLPPDKVQRLHQSYNPPTHDHSCRSLHVSFHWYRFFPFLPWVKEPKFFHCCFLPPSHEHSVRLSVTIGVLQWGAHHITLDDGVYDSRHGTLKSEHVISKWDVTIEIISKRRLPMGCL